MFTAFSDPALARTMIVVIAMHVLSLVAMALILLAFRRIQRSQQRFFGALYGVGSDVKQAPDETLERVWNNRPVLVWLYVIATILITLVTSIVFLFQPHIL